MLMPPKLLGIVTLAAVASAEAICAGGFTKITAGDFVEKLNPGWNAGNSLDAMPTETSWGQPLLVNSTFINVKTRGFNGVRIPVTWADHFISDAPSYTIDPDLLQRVSNVVDMAISNGLYTILNAHHDSWSWLDPSAAGANHTQMQEKFYRLWYQIGIKFGCRSSMLAFETINEPSGSTADDAAFLNSLHKIMIQAINDAGGFNSQRVVILCGLGDGWTTAVQYFERPVNITNPWALTWHFYGPWDFTATAFGRTIWGSDSDKQDAFDSFQWSRGNFSDVPIVIGEFAASPESTEAAARWKWYDFITYNAQKFNTSVMLWDAGGSFQVNSTAPWPDQTALNLIFKAAAGVVNTLPDSCENSSAPSQFTSAYVFQKQGEAVTDTYLPFLWNGNRLKSISYGAKGPRQLLANIDYTTDNESLIFNAPFMSKLFPYDSKPGLMANLTLHFEQAADLEIPAYLWAPPTLAVNSSTVTNSTAQNDLWIPINWKGLPQLAMVKAQMLNGSYLVDTWTQWRGPLYQGRLTFGNDWHYNSTHVSLTSSMLQAVYNAQEPTIFTFEFFPRQLDNTVNYTIYV